MRRERGSFLRLFVKSQAPRTNKSPADMLVPEQEVHYPCSGCEDVPPEDVPREDVPPGDACLHPTGDTEAADHRKAADAPKFSDMFDFEINLTEQQQQDRDFLSTAGVVPEDWLPAIRRRFPITNAPVAVPAKQRIVYSSTYKPKTVYDIITAEGIALVKAWLRKCAEDFRHQRAGGQKHRHRLEELVMDERYTLPEARGIVWDLRDPMDIKPLGPRPANTKINVDAVDKVIEEEDWPDKPLGCELRYGWFGYSNSLPLVTVLSPHHKSLWKVFDSTDAEMVAERDDKLWSLWTSTVPFWPLRVVPNGSVPKPRSAKRRRTCDLSWPKPEMYDQPLSVNSHVDPATMPKLNFPRIRDVSAASAILHSSGVELVYVKFDEDGAYKQTAMCQTECWKQVGAWDGKFVVDDRLQYGGAFAPNAYMRWGTLRKFLVMRKFREKLVVNDPRVQAWIDVRRTMFPDDPEQALPYWLALYIDDYFCVCLGHDLADQIIECMREFSKEWKIALSWAKFDLEGTPATEKNILGVDFLGKLPGKRYPADKQAWMLQEMPSWQDKEWVSDKELMSIMMRLRWASEVIYYLRFYLNSGFALLRKGQMFRGKIRLTERVKSDFLTATSLLTASEPVPALWADEWMKGAYRGWASDAAKCGFGGWMVLDGVWYVFQGHWTMEELLWLDINGLELAGIYFSSVLFCPLRPNLRLVVDTDNQASNDVINIGKASGAMGAMLPMCHVVWAANNCLVRSRHIAGKTNTSADQLSRFAVVTAMLGAKKVVWLTLSPATRDLSAAIQAAKAKSAVAGDVMTPGMVKRPIASL